MQRFRRCFSPCYNFRFVILFDWAYVFITLPYCTCLSALWRVTVDYLRITPVRASYKCFLSDPEKIASYIAWSFGWFNFELHAQTFCLLSYSAQIRIYELFTSWKSPTRLVKDDTHGWWDEKQSKNRISWLVSLLHPFFDRISFRFLDRIKAFTHFIRFIR